jgi:hypothetical protein
MPKAITIERVTRYLDLDSPLAGGCIMEHRGPQFKTCTETEYVQDR